MNFPFFFKWQLRGASSCVGVCSLSAREGTLSCIPSKWECINLSSQSHSWTSAWKTSILESLHISAQICASLAALWDFPVQQMCQGQLGEQRAVLPAERSHGKREDYLWVSFSFFSFFFFISHISAVESLSNVCFLSQELHRFWLKLTVFTKTFSLCLAGGCLYHLFYFDGLITWALNPCLLNWDLSGCLFFSSFYCLVISWDRHECVWVGVSTWASWVWEWCILLVSVGKWCPNFGTFFLGSE